MALRETGSLLALGLLGGLWATAWGNRRAQRPERTAMLDARTQVQVRLDAVRARAANLAQRDLPPEARRLVDQVVEQELLIHALLSRAATPEDVSDVDPEIEDALISLEDAATLIDIDMPADAPFAGLCSNDPGHGPPTNGAPDGVPSVCAECTTAVATGARPRRRQVTVLGQPVPFDDPRIIKRA